MRKAGVFVNGVAAGVLEERDHHQYRFTYHDDYQGSPVSLTMPIKNKQYDFDVFPPFFEGLLPEGDMLDALLFKYKLDKKDYFGQLMRVGKDVVGVVSLEEME